MLERRYAHMMEKLFYGSCFSFIPAAEGWLLACVDLSLGPVDQTAHFLLTTPSPVRPWPKQVRTDRGKCPLTAATDHPQAKGKAATYHQNRPHPPRPARQA